MIEWSESDGENGYLVEEVNAREVEGRQAGGGPGSGGEMLSETCLTPYIFSSCPN